MKRWIYSGQLSPIAELDSAGNVTVQFVGGYMIKNGVTYQLITDNLGSVRMVVDVNSSTVFQHLDYDEYGNVTQNTNPDFQPFAYAGGLYDIQTKLVRLGARDYDASIGGWTVKDPILFGGIDPNLYRYTFSDPINFIDSDGRIVPLILAGAAVGGIVSGGIYALTAGENFSWQGLAGAAVGGAIAGGIGVVATPIAAALGLGTGILGTSAVTAGAGLAAGAATASIDPCQKFTLGYALSSAAFGAAGGALGAKLFSTQGMSSFGQVGFPRTASGVTPGFLGGNAGPNARNAIYLGTPTAAFIGAGGPSYVQ